MAFDDQLQKYFEHQAKYEEFRTLYPVMNFINECHYTNHGFYTTVTERVGKCLSETLQKSKIKWHGPLVRYQKARPKSVSGIVRKLFAGCVGSLNPSNTEELLSGTNETLLSKVYLDIKDVVAGRIVGAFQDDIPKLVRLAKHQLYLHDFEIDDESNDKDYYANPQDGYQGYHFHVQFPALRHDPVTPTPRVLEIQVHTLVSNAWSELTL